MNKKKKINNLINILGITPKNINIYIEALTHKTFTNENKDSKSYEKLEFLGDSILQFTSSYYIYKHFKNVDEGTMSNIRAKNVSKEALSKISKNMGLNNFLIYSNNHDLKINDKICSDIFESIVAAIYLDLGLDHTLKFLNKFLFNNIKKTSTLEENLKDPKTRLQEKLQPYFKKSVHYQTNKINKTSKWKSEAICDDKVYGVGKGKTKIEAEINAAEDALNKYQNLK